MMWYFSVEGKMGAGDEKSIDEYDALHEKRCSNFSHLNYQNEYQPKSYVKGVR